MSTTDKKTDKKNALYFVKITAILLVITMCVAFLLSFVNELTKDVIAGNEEKKTTEAVKKLFPNAASPVSTEKDVGEIKYLGGFYEVSDGGKVVGYYANVSPIGFKGEVNMLVGLDTDGKVAGIVIISMSETVGIGDKINDEGFLDTFKGHSVTLTYKKGATGEGTEIDGISGATYSSKAVIAGTAAALEAYSKLGGTPAGE